MLQGCWYLWCSAPEGEWQQARGLSCRAHQECCFCLFFTCDWQQGADYLCWRYIEVCESGKGAGFCINNFLLWKSFFTDNWICCHETWLWPVAYMASVADLSKLIGLLKHRDAVDPTMFRGIYCQGWERFGTHASCWPLLETNVGDSVRDVYGWVTAIKYFALRCVGPCLWPFKKSTSK